MGKRVRNAFFFRSEGTYLLRSHFEWVFLRAIKGIEIAYCLQEDTISASLLGRINSCGRILSFDSKLGVVLGCLSDSLILLVEKGRHTLLSN